jgi:uncharacterized cupredoxin-like copper-binding protein
MTVQEEPPAERYEQAQTETGRNPMPFIVLGGALAAAAIAAVLVVMLGSSNQTSKPAAAPKAVPAAASQPAGSIGVTLNEFTVTPIPATAKAGSVTFSIRNAGNIKHEFVVIKTPKPAANLLKGGEADETGNVGEVGDVPSGSSKTLRLKLAAGHYALICNLPGHYLSGQHADFTVR